MIKSLSLIDDEVPADLPQNFLDALNMKPSEVKAATKAAAPAGATAGRVTVMADELEEEFSFSGVKDSVSKKIKSMRSLS
jgi:flagellar protein FliO/FliZ